MSNFRSQAAHWQMHMYQQQQQAQMAGVAGVGVIVPVAIPQVHQNPHGWIQDPKTGNWVHRGSQSPPEEAVQGPQAAMIQDPRTGQWGYPAGFQHPNPHPDVQNPQVDAPKCSRKVEKARRPFTDHQLLTLKLRFAKDQFIKVNERREMSKQIGLTPDQIKIWFQNKRHTARKQEQMRQFENRRNEERKEAMRIYREVRELTEQHDKQMVEKMEKLEMETEEEKMNENNDYFQL